eukprot:3900109-Rhodomonas_salina.1
MPGVAWEHARMLLFMSAMLLFMDADRGAMLLFMDADIGGSADQCARRPRPRTPCPRTAAHHSPSR